jgi:hypothetical protein
MAWLSWVNSSAPSFASRMLSQPYASFADIGQECVCGEDTNGEWLARCLSSLHEEGVGGNADLLCMADDRGVQLSKLDSAITASPGWGVSL